VPFVGLGQVDSALATVRESRADGMIVFPEGATMVSRATLAAFAVAQRLPTMFGWSEDADAGGLMSYGANQLTIPPAIGAIATRVIE
jgi:putative ABC transport system substrate-binding protein